MLHQASSQSCIRIRDSEGGTPATRRGALRRLLPARVLTPEEEVAAYLRSEGVHEEKAAQEDDSLAGMQLRQQQVTRLVEERKADVQRTAMARGRTLNHACVIPAQEHKTTRL